MWKFLINKNDQYSITNDQYQVRLRELVKNKKIQHIGKYYCLPKREKIIAIRKKREEISEGKIQKAKRVVHFLSYLPTIHLIALSGSVAMSNAEEDADIDIFVITTSHSLWITRFFVFLFLRLLGVQRDRRGKPTANTVCANMFMEEDFLQFPQKFQNLYSAHELVQLKILVNKHHTQEKLFAENIWIKKHLPNTNVNIQHPIFNIKHKIVNKLFLPLEFTLRNIQLWYMKPHKTREITEKHLIAFHPTNYAKHIFRAYNSRIQKYGI